MRELPRIFDFLLQVLPEEFRQQHRDAMRDLMAHYADGRPFWSRATIWIRASIDILWVAGALHLRAVRKRRRSSPPTRQKHSRILTGLATIAQDIRHCLRSLRRNAGLAVFATLIVGLGIGASVTVFSVVNAVLLRPLPFEDPDRLVFISNGEWGRGQALSQISVQVGYLQDLQDGSRLLSDVAGYFLFDGPGDHTLIGDGVPERLNRLRVTGNFFPLLGIKPYLGRLFSAEESTWNGPPAVLLTHGFWLRRFAADPTVVGRPLTLKNAPATIVGVLPPSYDFAAVFAPGSRIDFVTPFPLSEETNRWGNTLALVGRLAPGATIEAAEEEARTLASRNREGRNKFSPSLRPLREHVSGAYFSALLVLVGAVALVMLIVCANLSHLLLARGAAREKEIAIRAALGAHRRRLIQQLLTESVVLACTGAAVGLVLTFWGTHLVAGLDVHIPLLAGVRVDSASLGFTLLIAIVCGLGFGLVPAARMSGYTLNESLKERGRGSSGGRIRGTLIVAEVALACVLLVGAGLLIRSFIQLIDVDPGYEPRNAVAIRIDPGAQLATPEVRMAFYDEALRLARAAPGVEEVGLTDVLPMAFNRRWCMWLVGSSADSDQHCGFVRIVSDGYLQAMGLSLQAGRDFDSGDTASGRRVILINDILARSLWPGLDPLGRRVMMNRQEWEVIGVVQGMRHLALDQEPGPEFFLSMRQIGDFRAIHLIARGRASLPVLASGVRNALASEYPNLPVHEFRAVQDIVDQSVSARRFVVLLLGGFAGFALILASLGIYGVISYSVSQRKHELGIRIALGASSGDLRVSVLVETLKLAAAGMVLGVFAAWALGWVMQGLLFGVTATDPAVFVTVPVLLLTVSALAGYLPARRASETDPMQVLNAGP